MTFAEFISNPLAPHLIVVCVVMLGGCVALFFQSDEPTPEEQARIARNARVDAYYDKLRAEKLARDLAKAKAKGIQS